MKTHKILTVGTLIACLSLPPFSIDPGVVFAQVKSVIRKKVTVPPEVASQNKPADTAPDTGPAGQPESEEGTRGQQGVTPAGEELSPGQTAAQAEGSGVKPGGVTDRISQEEQPEEGLAEKEGGEQEKGVVTRKVEMPSETAKTTATTRVSEETPRTTTTTRGEIAEKRSLAPSLDVEPLRPAEDQRLSVPSVPEPELEEERAEALAESAGLRKKSFALITGIDPKMRLPYKEITYDPSNRVDPFAPLVREEPEQQEVAKRKEKRERKRRVPRTPLEKFDLSQLKLVGIVASDSGNIALVEESTGKGYIVKEGTYIGTRAGKVVEITRNKIVVEEEDEDFLGNITLRKRELKIQKPPGEDYYEM